MAAVRINDTFLSIARIVNRFCASPAATAAAFAVVLIWLLCGPVVHFSDGWQLLINTGTSVITVLMVFVLNSAQSRDTAAINAKLDAVIVAIEAADNRMVQFENHTEAHGETVYQDVVAGIDTPAAR
jgi:low affinity Fe/Cu permease